MEEKKKVTAERPKKPRRQATKPTAPEEIVDPGAPDEAVGGPQGEEVPKEGVAVSGEDVAVEEVFDQPSPVALPATGDPSAIPPPGPVEIPIEEQARKGFVILRVDDWQEGFQTLEVWDIPGNGALLRFTFMTKDACVIGTPQVVFVDNVRPDFKKGTIIRSLR